MSKKSFVQELKRRNVVKTAGAYAVAAWLLIQIAATIEEPLNLPDWVDTATIITVLIGFPIALIVAWVFEWTPEGLQKTEELEEGNSETYSKTTGKKLNRITIGALALVIILLLTERFFLASSELFEDTEPSIVVLPFVNMSNDGDNEYFSDGLSEEIRVRLSKLPQLTVTGRGASYLFKEKNIEYREIGEKLGVDHLLEGTVRKEGDQLRITASLIRTSDNLELWSEVYDKKFENIFSIQEELSMSVINQLKIQLSIVDVESINKRKTNSPQAFDAWLKASQLRGTSVKIDSAIFYYEEAIRYDDQYAEAYADLAGCYTDKVSYDQLTFEEAEPVIRSYLEKALFIDPNESSIYFELGRLYITQSEQPFADEDSLYLAKSEEALLKANELLPMGTHILSWLSILSDRQGQSEMSYEYAKRAYEIDPRPGLGGNLAISLAYDLERPDTALKVINEILEKYPEDQFSIDRSYRLFQKARIQEKAGLLGEAFITHFGNYTSDGKDYKTVSTLFDLSLLLDLPDLSKMFLDDFKILESTYYPYWYRDFLERQGEFDLLYDWVNDKLKDEYGDRLEQRLDVIQLYQNFQNEEYAEMENNLNAILESDENRYLSNTEATRYLAIALYKQGQDSLADSLVKSTLGPDASKWLIDMFMLRFSESVSTTIENQYFKPDGLGKSWILEIGILNFHWHLFDEAGVFDRIIEDRNQMRNKVINYLKSIGDWNPEWQVNDQVLFSKRPSYLARLKERDLSQAQ